MKIVVTMAGQSRRYREAGYDVPKPFLLIDGAPMIERVCRMFDPADEFLFVCDRTHLRNPRWRAVLEGAARSCRIIEVEPHERGPVASALAADPWVDGGEPAIIAYCDFTMAWEYRAFLRAAGRSDGALAVFRGYHPASFGSTLYAYARTNARGEVLEVREKRPFTDRRSEEFASTGVYYVARWRDFTTYGREVLARQASSEAYVSLIYNPMIRDGGRVGVFEVERFVCWGTPEDLREYVFWSEYFASFYRTRQAVG